MQGTKAYDRGTVHSTKHSVFGGVSEVGKRSRCKEKKSVGNGNLYRACYMYQVERLPVLVGQEHQEGSMNDCVLWHVATMHFVFSALAITCNAPINIKPLKIEN